MSSEYVLAVDAGNTKTVVLVADVHATILGRATTGPADIYSADREDTAVATVLDAVAEALADAQLQPADITAATCCMAGVDWPEDAVLWSRALRGRLPAARLEVLNDGYALLWCLNPAGVGAAVTVGTGPAVAARGPVGTTSAMGFWCQHPLGGAGLGELALKAVYLAELGLAAPTQLREALLSWFGLGDVETLLHHLTRRGAPGTWARVAAAAPVVLACADRGDPASVALVTDQARLLVDYTTATAVRAGLHVAGPPELGSGHDLSGWPLALGGGVVTSDVPVFRRALLAEIQARLPQAVPVVVQDPPVMGSLIGALRLIDPALADTALARLVGTTVPVGQP